MWIAWGDGYVVSHDFDDFAVYHDLTGINMDTNGLIMVVNSG